MGAWALEGIGSTIERAGRALDGTDLSYTTVAILFPEKDVFGEKNNRMRFKWLWLFFDVPTYMFFFGFGNTPMGNGAGNLPVAYRRFR